jgi:hypothetical protein
MKTGLFRDTHAAYLQKKAVSMRKVPGHQSKKPISSGMSTGYFYYNAEIFILWYLIKKLTDKINLIPR